MVWSGIALSFVVSLELLALSLNIVNFKSSVGITLVDAHLN